MKKGFAVAILLLAVLMVQLVISGVEAPLPVSQLNLIISSVPQGADIYIDGQYVGKTQKTIYFVRNSVDYSKMYSLRLVLSGYEDAEQNFQFEPDKAEKDIPITLNRIQQTPTSPPATPTLVPQTSSPAPATPPPTPIPAPTLVPQTSSTTPATPTPAPTLVPQTSSPTPSTSTPAIPTTTLVPHTYSPTPTPPGFLAIAVILAILCVYWISKRKHS